jgi:quercetin dioxygenase-like cupin family protein
MMPFPAAAWALVEQADQMEPIPVEILPPLAPDDRITADGVFIRTMKFERAGVIMAQHTHPYDHTSFVAAGSVNLWEDGVYAGSFPSGSAILIKKGVAHKFLTLEPNTTILCIHNWLNPEAAAFLREHGIEEEV